MMWSYSTHSKRYQDVGTKSLRKGVYTSLCGFLLQMVRRNVLLVSDRI